jgi:hypothetical protein
MYAKGKVFLATLALSMVAAPRANAGIPIDKACAQVFEEGREESEMVNVGKHGFKIKKYKSSVERAEGKITVKGYFWHDIDGENDRIYYTIVAEKGQAPQITVERIDINGLVGSDSKLTVGVTWAAGAAGGKVAETVSKGILKLANAVQRKLIGNWTPGIPVILEGMANYFAKQLDANAPGQEGVREKWKCTDFIMVAEGDKVWRQTDLRSHETLDWTEVRRENDFIELQHPGNNQAFGRLYNTEFRIKRPDTDYKFEINGMWVP